MYEVIVVAGLYEMTVLAGCVCVTVTVVGQVPYQPSPPPGGQLAETVTVVGLQPPGGYPSGAPGADTVTVAAAHELDEDVFEVELDEVVFQLGYVLP
jgi:hypothetical protein